MDSRTLKPHLAVLVTNLFFGINFIAVPFLTKGYIAPLGINLIRVAVSVALFWILFAFKPSEAGIDKKDVPRFLLCSLTGIVINQILFVKGLSLTLPIHASLLALVTPIFITFIAAFIYKETLTGWKLAGLVLGISGAMILIMGRERHSVAATNILLGNIYIIINAIFYAFYFSLVKPLMKKYSAIHVMRWVFTIGLPFMLVFGWKDFSAIEWSQFNTLAWSAIAFVAIAATFLAYLFNLYAINKLGAAVTGTYIYTQPIFATILAVWLMGEKITINKIIAAILILAGVWMVGRKASPSQP